MSKRERLKKSLEKKREKFKDKIEAHFDDVRSANGQPLNDKRCGRSTISRWEKQNKFCRESKKRATKRNSGAY